MANTERRSFREPYTFDSPSTAGAAPNSQLHFMETLLVLLTLDSVLMAPSHSKRPGEARDR